ncbi:hypothetical protein PoB_002616400 [Plakobranchus ocellatus]|uniref:Uncharacterized protein n=1 Tax=Plakobranchus ocellatus TaxID=259542 RepID=A0AAV3ZWH6_9GAST|nr:hypothetical protein PoB_002616400 [Plakobranchus ocellatus]
MVRGVDGLEDYGRLGRTKLCADYALAIMEPTKASLAQATVEDAMTEVLRLALYHRIKAATILPSYRISASSVTGPRPTLGTLKCSLCSTHLTYGEHKE